MESIGYSGNIRISVGVITLAVFLLAGCVRAAVLTVNDSGGADFTKIQDAINNASNGDIILVSSGTYYENVNVSKRLILRGVDTGGGKPVVNASENGSAIMLNAGNSTVDGFIVVNAKSNKKQRPPLAEYGIRLESNNNIIINNTALNNDVGISSGIYGSSNNSMVINNTVSKNDLGIALESSNSILRSNIVLNNGGGINVGGNNNIIDGNIASNNSYHGISVGSSNSSFTNNIMTGNKYNLYFSPGSPLDNQIDTSNLMDGKYIYYLNGAADTVYDSSTNAGTIYCINCINVTIKDLDLNDTNYFGIAFWNTTRSKIQNVKSSNNTNGIFLGFSSNNTLSGLITSYNDFGIYLVSSNNNALINNTASFNTENIYLDSSSNNTLTGNSASGGIYGIYLSSSRLYPPTNGNTLKDNNVFNNENGINLDYASYNILIGNRVYSNNGSGIGLTFSSNNNTLTGNNVIANNLGIYLDFSSANIYVDPSSTNMIYNNILNNTNNFYFYGTSYSNYWNTSKQAGKNIVEGPYLGGNFWANLNRTSFSQTCEDGDGDGICDSSYMLDGNNIDYLPLASKPTIIDMEITLTPTPAIPTEITKVPTADGTEKAAGFEMAQAIITLSSAYIFWRKKR